jgi:hypothetical protein
MEARTNEDRAILLLEYIKPELLKLLKGAPSFGSVGIDIVFHNEEITRILTRMEISRKPRTGGLYGN